jgi:hypothetical protein
VVSVQMQVTREPTARLLDVGAGLVQGQRKAIELYCNLFCRVLIGFGRRVKRCVLCNILSSRNRKSVPSSVAIS